MLPKMRKEYDLLCDAAKQARENAYAPYSNYRVGAALLSDDGRIFTGCNVENASYSVCLCAERSALGQAVMSGQASFQAIALYAGEDKVTPCGMCRQALVEFGDMDVICPDGQGRYSVMRLSQLLPHSFHLK